MPLSCACLSSDDSSSKPYRETLSTRQYLRCCHLRLHSCACLLCLSRLYGWALLQLADACLVCCPGLPS